jgi:toxin ParE1/3/4
MSVRILRRLKAVEDAEEIADYIAQDSLDAALRFLECTETTLSFLAGSPSIGSKFPVESPSLANLRTCRVKGFPNHLIFYIKHVGAIEVVRILHGARDIQTELGES